MGLELEKRKDGGCNPAIVLMIIVVLMMVAILQLKKPKDDAETQDRCDVKTVDGQDKITGLPQVVLEDDEVKVTRVIMDCTYGPTICYVTAGKQGGVATNCYFED